MALRFIKQMKPEGVVAVACEKELELGIQGVENAAQVGEAQMPVIVVVPLSRDGCVDTEVDVEQALNTIESTGELAGLLQPSYAMCVPA